MPYKNLEDRRLYNRSYNILNKELLIQKRKLAYQKNKIERIINSRNYRLNNKQKIAIRDKNRYDSKKSIVSQRMKIYYQKNKEKIKFKRRKYYYANLDKIKEINRNYARKNKEIVTSRNKSWKQNNPEKFKSIIERYKPISRINSSKSYYKHRVERIKLSVNINRKKRLTDPSYKLKELLRSYVFHALNYYTLSGKTRSSKKYGIDYTAIINHLKPFPENIKLYHIDHIRPLASFNFVNPDGSTNFEEIKKAFAPENHQWLLARDNLSKSANWNGVNYRRSLALLNKPVNTSNATN